MSSLAKKFKKAGKTGDKKSSKRASHALPTIAEYEEYKEEKEEKAPRPRMGKPKRPKSKHPTVESPVPESKEGVMEQRVITDTKRLLGLARLINEALRAYSAQHPRLTNVDPIKARGDFPNLYRAINLLQPLTQEDLINYENDPRLGLLRDNLGNSLLRSYNEALLARPEEYLNLRSELLERLQLLPPDNRPFFAPYILREDTLFSQEELALLEAEYRLPESLLVLFRRYNTLLSSLPHLPPMTHVVEIEREGLGIQIPVEFTFPSYIPEEKITSMSLEQLKGDLTKVRNAATAAARLAEKKLTDQKAEMPGLSRVSKDVSGETRMHMRVYRRAIKQEIAKAQGSAEEEVSEEDADTRVTESQVNEFLLTRENLPYWTFLADQAVQLREQQEFSTRDSVRQSLKNYPEISTQFARLYLRLAPAQQAQFASTVFQMYPLEDYPKGPDRSVLSLLIEYYNTLGQLPELASDETDLDTRLALADRDELMELVKGFTSAQLLRYRPIVFGKYPQLSQADQAFILALYNPLFIKAGGLRYNQALEVLTSADNTPITSDDFFLPWNEDTERRMTRVLEDSLPSGLISAAGLMGVPGEQEILTLKVRVNNQPILLTALARSILFKTFHANLPVDPLFDTFLTKLLQELIEKALKDVVLEDLPLDLAPELVDELYQQVDKAREASRDTIIESELQTQAWRVGLQGKTGIAVSRQAALLRLQYQRDSQLITEQEYEQQVKDIDNLISAYDKLEARGAGDDADLANRRRLANKTYTARVRELQVEAREEGQEPDMEAIQSTVWKEIIAEGILSAEEVRSMETKKIRIPQLQAKQRQQTQRELKEIVKTMPEALKISLQELINNINGQMKQVQAAKREETANYFRFAVELMIAAYGWKSSRDPQTLEDIERKYTNLLPPIFIKKIIQLLGQPGTTGATLLSYISQYVRKQTLLLKNPLIRQFTRRQRRYDKLFQQLAGTGTLEKVKANLPEVLPPHLKECMMTHQLRPWLELPNALSWQTLIAHPSGKTREQLEGKERSWFNVPQGRQVALVTPQGKTLHFYKPTTAYWMMHCRLNHRKGDPGQCNLDNLIKTLTDEEKSAQFYELIYQAPLEAQMEKNQATIFYQGDTPTLKFLSLDPSNYTKECAWFKERYQAVEEVITSLRNQALPGGRIERAVREAARNNIGSILGLLRLRYGLTSDTTELARDARKLEQALYDLLSERAGSFTVHDYLREPFSLLLFIDPSEPLGQQAGFFGNLVAQASPAYYPALLRQFPSASSRLPELFLLKEGSITLKKQVLEYIEAKTQVLIDQLLLKLVAAGKPQQEVASLGSLFSRRDEQLAAALPELTGLKLSNICKNRGDYEGMEDSWLMYYASGGEVYCLSKLQLANMAQSGNYTFQGVQFDQAFVDSFRDYSSFAAEDLQLKNKYIEESINALVSLPANRELLTELTSLYNFFGEISQAELEEIGLFERIQPIAGQYDSYVLMVITNRVNELIQAFNSKHILDLARQYIQDNSKTLNQAIEEQYKAYNAGSVGSSSEDAQKTIVGPVADIVIRYVEDSSSYTFSVGEQDKQRIISLIEQLVYGEPEKFPDPECYACKAVIEAGQDIYSTIAQSQEGKEMVSKYLKFCSSKCFSKHAMKELSREDVETSRLQISVNKVTEPYLNYTELLFWCKFPSSFRLPEAPSELDNFIATLARIKGLSIEAVRASLEGLSKNESALGILTTNSAGQALSQTELWDHVRAHPMFVPSVNELLSREKYEALAYLARKFNVPIYSQDYDEAYAYYFYSPEELRNVWKQLRALPGFEKILYSTVRTYDPYKPQIMNNLQAGEDVMGYILSGMKTTRIAPLDRDVWTDVRKFFLPGLESLDLLEEIIKDPERFKLMRMDIITQASRAFPQLKLAIDQRKKQRLVNLQNTLELWLENHKRAVLERTPVVLEIKARKSGPTSLLSTDQLINELGELCNVVDIKAYRVEQTITVQNLSRWTLDYLTNSPAPERLNFKLNFYPKLKVTYKCSLLARLEQEYVESLYNLEQLNSALDEAIADTIIKRHHIQATLAPMVHLPYRKRRHVPKDEQVDVEAALQQMMAATSVIAPLQLEAQAPQALTREGILEGIKAMRQNLRKQAREKPAPTLTKKIVWEEAPREVVYEDELAEPVEEPEETIYEDEPAEPEEEVVYEDEGEEESREIDYGQEGGDEGEDAEDRE